METPQSGINTDLGTTTEPSQAMLEEQLLKHVESKASTAPKIRQLLLRSTFSQCADFKVICNQQPQFYRFVSSPSRHTINMTCMTVARNIDCSETIVALSLWQSLGKEEHPRNLYCLEPDLIWSTCRWINLYMWSPFLISILGQESYLEWISYPGACICSRLSYRE
jgi:hypothetical protein